ncbi:hypothetical protein PVL29_026384 [Vitis rotundifolia]|uniref:SKP1 component dimerisation domain-containing protein n=1 Tax=Vitis rotundifolia TaxID=103349 RepID=A0AA39D6N0_VITRO|nr:hypothetical protein PVL29_026384 [Vitis rotundifolia]
MLEVVTDENMVIPVLEVNGKSLAKIVSYCSKHAKQMNEEDEKVVVDLREWDEILLDFVTTKLAEMVREKTTDQVRKKFKIQNDFTKEKEEKI